MQIKYTGGPREVQTPWRGGPVVKRGTPVEAPDEDAEVLLAQEATPWARVADVEFTGSAVGQAGLEITFTPSAKLAAEMPKK